MPKIKYEIDISYMYIGSSGDCFIDDDSLCHQEYELEEPFDFRNIIDAVEPLIDQYEGYHKIIQSEDGHYWIKIVNSAIVEDPDGNRKPIYEVNSTPDALQTLKARIAEIGREHNL